MIKIFVSSCCCHSWLTSVAEFVFFAVAPRLANTETLTRSEWGGEHASKRAHSNQPGHESSSNVHMDKMFIGAIQPVKVVAKVGRMCPEYGQNRQLLPGQGLLCFGSLGRLPANSLHSVCHKLCCEQS